MTNETVAWSMASDKGAEFITVKPPEGMEHMLSAWTLPELVELLNVTIEPEEQLSDDELRKQFQSFCNIDGLSNGLSPEEQEKAFQFFKRGALMRDHSLLYAQQRANVLDALLKRKFSFDDWKKVEAVCWQIFADGGKQYRGCTKERLEELYNFLVKGKEMAP